VLDYVDVLRHGRPVGKRVVIVGAGGIGFDVAEFLLHQAGDVPLALDRVRWQAAWGVTDPETGQGGLAPRASVSPAPIRQLTLLQRRDGKPGAELGKTTGWIHRAQLKMQGVAMQGGVNYERIEAGGLQISHGKVRKNPSLIEADSIILCAGQESLCELQPALEAAGCSVLVIGGARDASGLDAKRAIEQGCRLGATL
jgi:2,4-dienoyl-CoA reductase (NADPH2)